ncbi:hypothetical protein F0L68_20295 [Solihabitans fulvus]|uniref:YCII-related domain-containing protein n=1 Tax=Solihabitans fulvus TaxID=1892852 RepID=A0A5B2XBB5_9PSEU|nr:YciI family protein [Solihabitans fulvus]KAA2260072.1 hypothetical protein F0L68_20295 [Solihabitans fulvus]
MAKFVVELVFGDNREERLAVRPRHREYLRELADRDVLLLAGPWADDAGAMLVYEVADEAELREILAADPYTPAAVVAETRVREWQALTGRLLA